MQKRLSRPACAVFLLLAASLPSLAVAQDQVTAAHHACASTMGLNPANADYDLCVRSLLQSVSAATEARRIEHVRQRCLTRGYQPGTADFALCVVQADPTSRR